jgi:hypothetical protein
LNLRSYPAISRQKGKKVVRETDDSGTTKLDQMRTAHNCGSSGGLLKLYPKTIKRLEEAGSLPGMKISRVWRFQESSLDERWSNPRRTRYQHGSLQLDRLDKRRKGPAVWVYRWREYWPNGKTQRRGEIMELLRHADVRTTMNVYTQAVSEQKRRAHSSVVQMVLAEEKRTMMSQLDTLGHGRRCKFRGVSWLMVGAIGFEPMTSTV